MFSRFRFPVFKQHDAVDCGPTCLRMVAAFYGKRYSLQTLYSMLHLNFNGTSLMSLSQAAKKLGFDTLAGFVAYDRLDQIPLPAIVHWRQNHFIVVYRVQANRILAADPNSGLVNYSRQEFEAGWLGKGQSEGIVLLLEPTTDFHEKPDDKVRQRRHTRLLYQYLFSHKKAVVQVLGWMLLVTVIQMIFPFLTQAVVDQGINGQNLSLVYLILLAQLTLYGGRTLADFCRSRILLRVGTRLNIGVISDFLTKLMKLPIAYFNARTTGDLLQRINDHYRIQTFLTQTTLGILFAVAQLVAFSMVLAFYDWRIFLVFLGGTVVYVIWVLRFMERRRMLDFKRFDQLSENQSMLIQLIRGMQAIKLSGSEQQKRWEWQELQEKLYHVNMDSLLINQYQQGGGFFLNELKNIVMMLLAVTAVVNGMMTLGTLIAIQFIVGALSQPVEQILGFLRSAQDAGISFDRLAEVHDWEEEKQHSLRPSLSSQPQGFFMRNLYFSYGHEQADPVLHDLTLRIPAGGVTAIVGPSGSGKTTLLTLLLKFHAPTIGSLLVGNQSLSEIDHRSWRAQCGVVMQNGYLFNDTIARNIALGASDVDYEKLSRAAHVANLHEFIASLPLGYDTKIGTEGHGLSQGQKQRLLIARAVYKNPLYLFFDEATNALDAENERVIMENLTDYFNGRTVVIIAHRLSTVQNADQIVVLDKGCIVEQGTHRELTAVRGTYYHLVKNQLELGN